MARKTDGEKVDEMQKLLATLTERLDNVRAEVKELKQRQDEEERKRWMLVMGFLASGLSLIVSLIVALVSFRR